MACSFQKREPTLSSQTCQFSEVLSADSHMCVHWDRQTWTQLRMRNAFMDIVAWVCEKIKERLQSTKVSAGAMKNHATKTGHGQPSEPEKWKPRQQDLLDLLESQERRLHHTCKYLEHKIKVVKGKRETISLGITKNRLDRVQTVLFANSPTFLLDSSSKSVC